MLTDIPAIADIADIKDIADITDISADIADICTAIWTFVLHCGYLYCIADISGICTADITDICAAWRIKVRLY